MEDGNAVEEDSDSVVNVFFDCGDDDDTVCSRKLLLVLLVETGRRYILSSLDSCD